MTELSAVEQIYKNLILSIFGTYALWHILLLPLLTGILCSFAIEGINTITTPKISGKLVMFLTCLGVSILMWFLFPTLIPDWAFKALMLLLNFTVALGFYHSFGQKLVQFVMKKGLSKIGLDRNADGEKLDI